MRRFNEGKHITKEKSLWDFLPRREDASGEVVERTPVEAPFRVVQQRLIRADCPNGGENRASTAYVFSGQGQWT